MAVHLFVPVLLTQAATRAMLENPGPDGHRGRLLSSVHRGHDAAGGDHQLCRRAVFLLSPASFFVNG